MQAAHNNSSAVLFGAAVKGFPDEFSEMTSTPIKIVGKEAFNWCLAGPTQNIPQFFHLPN
jgi:hypothetical protein